MVPFAQSPLFTLFQNPATGARFFILTRKVAPVQQGF